MRLDDPLANVTEIIAPISHLVDGELYPFEETLAPSTTRSSPAPTGSVLRLDTPRPCGRFDMTGDWGWNVIPGDVQYATIATVDEWYRGNQLPAIGGREEGEQESRNIYLPREVQETLIPWT